MLAGRRLAEPGVIAERHSTATAIEPELREPGKFGDFSWIDPTQLPEGMFGSTRALLERLP
jgi:hypothetical protein